MSGFRSHQTSVKCWNIYKHRSILFCDQLIETVLSRYKIVQMYSFSTAHKSRSLQISERFCLTSSLIPDYDCNSTSSVDIYFSPIICLQFKQYLFILLQKCKKVESLNWLSKYYKSLACGSNDGYWDKLQRSLWKIITLSRPCEPYWLVIYVLSYWHNVFWYSFAENDYFQCSSVFWFKLLSFSNLQNGNRNHRRFC